MKIHIRSFVYSVVLSALLLWGCSGSSNREAKTTPQNTPVGEEKLSTAAPSTAAVEPAAPVADHPTSASKPRKTAAKAPVSPPAPAPQTPPPVASSPSPGPTPAAVPAPAAADQAPHPVPAAVPSAPPTPVVDTREVTIPAGTEIAVRMIDSVDSRTSHVGETFRGSIDSPVVVDNQTVLPRGGDVQLKLKEVSSAGDLRGRSDLQIELDKIFIGKKGYDVESNVYKSSGASQGEKTARNVGIGAAVGAAIGAITGGGKGAAIGAGVGAGGGVAGTVIARGEQVRIPSETRLTFTLKDPVEVTVPAAPLSSDSSDTNLSSGPARLEAPPDTSSQGNRPRGGYGGRRRPLP